jgi:predicted kinase
MFGSAPRLVVFSGLPGTGKSALATGLGRALSIPVLTKDIIEAALWRNGIGRDQRSGWIAYELLTALAESQLALSSSAILDCVSTTRRLREGWQELAARHGAVFRAIECVCSDEQVHRSRLAGRSRNIPGWYELSWEDVEQVRRDYEPWTTERLVLDAVGPPTESLRAAIDYVSG